MDASRDAEPLSREFSTRGTTTDDDEIVPPTPSPVSAPVPRCDEKTGLPVRLPL